MGGRGRGRGSVAKAGMHCPVFWTPRAAAAALAGAERGGGGDETRRGETVGLWLPPGERASDCSALRTGYCALSLSHMAAEVVLQQLLVLIATSRTASPPNGSHDAHMCIRPEVRRTVVQQEGGWELAILRFQ